MLFRWLFLAFFLAGFPVWANQECSTAVDVSQDRGGEGEIGASYISSVQSPVSLPALPSLWQEVRWAFRSPSHFKNLLLRWMLRTHIPADSVLTQYFRYGFSLIEIEGGGQALQNNSNGLIYQFHYDDDARNPALVVSHLGLRAGAFELQPFVWVMEAREHPGILAFMRPEEPLNPRFFLQFVKNTVDRAFVEFLGRLWTPVFGRLFESMPFSMSDFWVNSVNLAGVGLSAHGEISLITQLKGLDVIIELGENDSPIVTFTPGAVEVETSEMAANVINGELTSTLTGPNTGDSGYILAFADVVEGAEPMSLARSITEGFDVTRFS